MTAHDEYVEVLAMELEENQCFRVTSISIIC